MNGITEKNTTEFPSCYKIYIEICINRRTKMIRNKFSDLDRCYGSLLTILSHLPFCSTFSKLSNTWTKIFQGKTLSLFFAATNLSNSFCFDRIFDEEMFAQKKNFVRNFPCKNLSSNMSVKSYCHKRLLCKQFQAQQAFLNILISHKVPLFGILKVMLIPYWNIFI